MNKKGTCILSIGLIVAVIIFVSFGVKKYAKANDVVNNSNELTRELENELNDKTTEIIEIYFNQEYDKLYDKFSQAAKSIINTQILKAQYDYLFVNLKFKNVCNGVEVEKIDNGYNVYKWYECEEMKVRGCVVFNKNYELEGINLCGGQQDTKFEIEETDEYREEIVNIGE